MKRNQKITINISGESHRVKVLKILEILSNGNGFAKVKFSNGYITIIAFWK